MLAPVESRVRALVQQRLTRGRVEVQLSRRGHGAAGARSRARRSAARAARAAFDAARARGLVAGELTASDVLRIPQVLEIRPRARIRPRRRRRRASPALVEGCRRRRARRARRDARTEGRFIEADLDARLRRSLAASSTTLERLAREGQAASRGAAARAARRSARRPAGRPGALSRRRSCGSSRGRTSTRRSSGCAATSSTGAALADGPGAVRPQARLPGAGDESRDQHDRLEGGRRARDRGGDRRQGRARADAGAGPECRVRPGRARGSAVRRLGALRHGQNDGRRAAGRARRPNLRQSRSYTSRPARPGEADGVDYNFVSRAGVRGDGPPATNSSSGPTSSATCTARPGAIPKPRSSSGRRPRAGHRRAGRPAGARQVPGRGRHLRAAAVVRGARVAAARPEQGSEPAAIARRLETARAKWPPWTSTTTSS